MLRLSRPPPLRNLRAFCVAGRQQSFKSAAEELCLTPSAVSHQIRELERLLGLKLFERRTPAAHPPTADVSILPTAAVPPGLSSARLFACPLIAVCAPEHAGRVARLGSAVFAALPMIVDRSRPFAWSGWAEEAGLATPEPQQVIELDTMTASAHPCGR